MTMAVDHNGTLVEPTREELFRRGSQREDALIKHVQNERAAKRRPGTVGRESPTDNAHGGTFRPDVGIHEGVFKRVLRGLTILTGIGSAAGATPGMVAGTAAQILLRINNARGGGA